MDDASKNLVGTLIGSFLGRMRRSYLRRSSKEDMIEVRAIAWSGENAHSPTAATTSLSIGLPLRPAATAVRRLAGEDGRRGRSDRPAACSLGRRAVSAPVRHLPCPQGACCHSSPAGGGGRHAIRATAAYGD